MHDSGSQHPRRCSRVPIFRAPVPRAPILPRANLPRADLPRTDLPRAVLSCRSSRTPIFPSAVLPHADFNAHRSLRAPFLFLRTGFTPADSSARRLSRAVFRRAPFPARRFFARRLPRANPPRIVLPRADFPAPMFPRAGSSRTVFPARQLFRAPVHRAPSLCAPDSHAPIPTHRLLPRVPILPRAVLPRADFIVHQFLRAPFLFARRPLRPPISSTPFLPAYRMFRAPTLPRADLSRTPGICDPPSGGVRI